MFTDYQGRDKEKKIAVVLALLISGNTKRKFNTKCYEIINNFQQANCNDLHDFSTFITTNNPKLNYWRYYVAVEHDLVKTSCIAKET